MALRAEVVDLIRLHGLDDADQIRRIRQIPVVQDEAQLLLVRILIEMIDSIRIKERRPALDAVDLVALLDEELGQVRAVLAGDPRDERALDDGTPVRMVR